MGDPGAVGAGDRIGQRDGDLQQARERQPLAGQQLRQSLSLDQLHRDEVNALGLFHRVQRHDVGVVQSGNGAGFPLETGPPVRIFGHLGRQHLQGDLSVQPGVLGDVDLAHPALTQAAEDFVVCEALADHSLAPCRIIPRVPVAGSSRRPESAKLLGLVWLARGLVERHDASESPSRSGRPGAELFV